MISPGVGRKPHQGTLVLGDVMSSIITRRTALRGLFAAPAIVAASSLMPLRGLVMPTGISMRLITNYIPGPILPLDVLYGIMACTREMDLITGINEISKGL